MDTAAPPATENRAEELLEAVQRLQEALDAAEPEGTRQLAQELVSCIVQMYGTGLERILAALMAAGEPGRRIAESLSGDPLVATLLLIHDLHPVPLDDRVQ